MEHIAKIFRHRHKHLHYMNDDLKDVKEETHFKIVFSHPDGLKEFQKWIREHGGEYDYDKENSCQRGKLPKEIQGLFVNETCWCDVLTFYLLHVAGYTFVESINPYKAEIYHKIVKGK